MIVGLGRETDASGGEDNVSSRASLSSRKSIRSPQAGGQSDVRPDGDAARPENSPMAAGGDE